MAGRDLEPDAIGSLDSAPPLSEALERLVRAVTDLASARTLDEIVDIVRHAARELTGADGATFVLRDQGEDQELCYYVDEDAIAPLWRGHRFPLDTCISGWAMLNREPAVIEDIYADDRIPHDAYRPTFVKSLVMVPVRTADPVAAIGNYWADRRRPTPTEVRLLQVLADSTAVALENVRVLSELETRVRERTAELAAANADLERFVAVAAHDLKGPLDTLASMAELIERKHGADLPDDARQMLEAMQDRARSTGTFLLTLLDYARAGAAALEVGDVDLDAVAQEAVTALGSDISARRARVTVGGLPSVRGDAGLLGQVFQNLLANAITYTPGGEVPDVTVSARRVGDAWEVSVADRGPGVPKDDRERIFEPFRRGNTAGEVPGSGLGLAISRSVVERHGGTLRIRDREGGGAVFSFTLPDAA